MGMEEMEHEGGQKVPASSPFTLKSKLKLVGECLEAIREFSEALTVKLTPNHCQNTCVVEFSDG